MTVKTAISLVVLEPRPSLGSVLEGEIRSLRPSAAQPALVIAGASAMLRPDPGEQPPPFWSVRSNIRNSFWFELSVFAN